MIARSLALAVIGRRQPSLIKYIRPGQRTEDELVWQQILQDFGFVPAPILMHSVVEGLFPGIWMVLRETTLVGLVPRLTKEAISVVVSQSNRCPFCTDSHEMALAGLKRADVTSAIGDEDWGRLSDKRLAAVLQWVKCQTPPYRDGESTQKQEAPFSKDEAPEVIGTMVLFHYLNRVVNVFLKESPLPCPARMPRSKRLLEKLGGWTFSALLTRALEPGRSLPFLPAAELAADLAWARTNSRLADAFSRFDKSLETAAGNTLSSAARDILRNRLADWRGEPPPVNKRWVDEALSDLREHNRLLVRIALLSALAPYQITPSEIEHARDSGASDADLLATVAWGAFSAARRHGQWAEQVRRSRPLTPPSADHRLTF